MPSESKEELIEDIERMLAKAGFSSLKEVYQALLLEGGRRCFEELESGKPPSEGADPPENGKK